ncbi:MAG TPA: AMP-binding protein [Stellaceae bacterium]|nr:AMP-binding protein [Stellaceae bacterium]
MPDGLRQSESLARFLARLGANFADSPAVIWGDERVSFAALDEESRRLASGLADLGIARGDRVALWLPNTPAWLALHFACARLGAIVVAINTRFRSAELADIVARSGARILVLWPGFREIDFIGILAAVDRDSLDRLERIVVYGDNAGAAAAFPGGNVLGKPILPYAILRDRPPCRDDFGAGPVGVNIFTTSGTTSAPKFVLHDHYSVLRHAGNVARGFGYAAPDSVVLQALPLCGVFGFCQAMACLAAGRPLVMQATFEAEAAARLIVEHKVTGFNGSDEMFARLLAASNEAVPFPSLRFCGYAAFNPTLDSIVAEADLRGLRIAGLYGASEVQALFALQDPARPAASRARPGGMPIAADYQVRVRDPETDIELPDGGSGELEFRGSSTMAGYFGDPEVTAKTIAADGWVRSGDLGHRLADGSFVFETRMGDVLRLGGYLVAPSEIEAHLGRHAAIDGCQVVGVADAGGLQSVAFVTLRAGAAFDEPALRRFCSDGLARFKVPVRIFALDSFPTTTSANGTKVQRAKLREMAQTRLLA